MRTSLVALVGVGLVSGCGREPARAGEVLAATTPSGSAIVERARTLFGARVSLVAGTSSLIREGSTIWIRPATLRNQATSLRVGVPDRADAALSIEASGMRVAARPIGFASSVLEWHERVAAYADVTAGMQALRVVDASGVEDHYLVDAPRDTLEIAYDVALLQGVAGLRLVDATLELLDAEGAPRLRMTRPVAFDARGVERAGALEVRGCAYDSSALGPWGRAVTDAGARSVPERCTIVATVDGRGLAYPVLVDPAWQTGDSLRQDRAHHRLVRIAAGPDGGKIVAVGGTGMLPSSTELFDPTTKTWAGGAPLPTGANIGAGVNAVGLTNGVVLASGGFSATANNATAVAVVRNPNDGLWSPAAAMTARAWHAMVPMTIGGKSVALAIGGQTMKTPSSAAHVLKTSDYYDPGTFDAAGKLKGDDGWTAAGPLLTARAKARAVVLGDGKVLIAGGASYGTAAAYLESAELFDPVARTWSPAPSMATKRTELELVALAGVLPRAFALGGSTDGTLANAIDTVEYYDGAQWTTLGAKLSAPRVRFSSARLDDGRMLVAGGEGALAGGFSDLVAPGATPALATVTAAGPLSVARHYHAMIALPGLGAIAAGGLDATNTETKAVDRFDTTLGVPCGSGCTNGLTCVNGVCCKSASCPAGESCASPGREGICTKAKGATCTSNAECASGFCVDGVCCESACAGGCRQCNATPGTCTVAPIGSDPGGFCRGTGDPTCARRCDGAGACGSYAPEGTNCAATAADAGPDGAAPFCEIFECGATGACVKRKNVCGLTCSTSVTCSESTQTCTADPTKLVSAKCLIEGACYDFGELDPTDPCRVCEPPSSRTQWSLADACRDGGVEDIGVRVDSGPRVDAGIVDSGRDTATDVGSFDDASSGVMPLPEAPTCGCRTPRRVPPSGLAVLPLLVLALIGRRRAR